MTAREKRRPSRRTVLTTAAGLAAATAVPVVGTQAATDPIVDLARRCYSTWQRFCVSPETPATEAARDRLAEAATALEAEIIQTPATTIEGAAVKARFAAEQMKHSSGPRIDALVESVARDLERFTGHAVARVSP